jgi:cell division protease FtsH
MLIEENRDKMEAMTKALLEWETLDANQLDDIMAGLPPRSPKPTQSSSQPPRKDGPTGSAQEPAAA